MQNLVQDGVVLNLTAPYDRSSGQGAKIGAIFGVACSDVLSGVDAPFQVQGVFELTKVGSQAWSQGDRIYWNDSSTPKQCSNDSSVGMMIGVATEAVASGAGDVLGKVHLSGCAPELLEGPQALIVALTDSTGGSGTHDDTLADGLTATAITGTIGGSPNGALAGSLDATYTPALDNEVVANADAQGDIVAAAAGACAGGAEPSAAQVDTAIATAVAPLQANDATLAVAIAQLVVDDAALREGLREALTMINTCVTDLGVQNQNDSDLAQKILEIRTALITAGILDAA